MKGADRLSSDEVASVMSYVVCRLGHRSLGTIVNMQWFDDQGERAGSDAELQGKWSLDCAPDRAQSACT